MKQISIINSLSDNILTELNKETPSFGYIQETMSKRQDHIDEFGIDLQNEPVHEFSDEEKELFNHFFDEFIVINQKIKDVISDVLENHKDQLFSAQKQRKAEDGYHFLAKPEISYYTK